MKKSSKAGEFNTSFSSPVELGEKGWIGRCGIAGKDEEIQEVVGLGKGVGIERWVKCCDIK